MYNLTDVINSGKSDWANMQKRLLKESGETEFRSDIPATTPIIGGGGDTTDDLRELTKQNIMTLSNTPDYQKFRESQQIALSKEEKDALLKRLKELKIAKNVKPSNLNKSPEENLDDALVKSINDYQTYVSEEFSKIAQNINEFNQWSDEAVKRWQRGLGVQFRSFPTPNNKNEFKDSLNTVGNKSSPHILNYLLPLVKVHTNVTNEAKIRIPSKYDDPTKVPAVNSPSMNDPALVDPQYKGPIAHADPTKEKTPATTAEFAGWLGNKGIETRTKMVELLSKIMNSMRNIEKYETIIQGFEYIIQKIQNARSGAKVTNAKKEVLKLANKQDNAEVEAAANDLIQQTEVPQQPEQQPTVSKEPTGAPMNEEVAPRTKRGPGKVFDVYADQNENVETAQDVTKKKLQNINEGWKKYSEKKTPNKQKPDDFTLLMG